MNRPYVSSRIRKIKKGKALLFDYRETALRLLRPMGSAASLMGLAGILHGKLGEAIPAQQIEILPDGLGLGSINLDPHGVEPHLQAPWE